jgi:hypothetical protein
MKTLQENLRAGNPKMGPNVGPMPGVGGAVRSDMKPETRNPKAEGRRKSEGRNPNQLPLQPGSKPSRLTDFGFRASAFGFRGVLTPIRQTIKPACACCDVAFGGVWP